VRWYLQRIASAKAMTIEKSAFSSCAVASAKEYFGRRFLCAVAKKVHRAKQSAHITNSKVKIARFLTSASLAALDYVTTART
jgi:hypothetical protein